MSLEFRGPILVADDEPNMREALELTLARMGFDVTLATDGQEALARLHSSDAFRLLVTDVNMPRIDGMEVLREAQRIRPTMPVVVITGFGTISNAVEAMKLGAADYIVKPFTAEALEAAVAKHLDQVSTPVIAAPKSDERPFITKDSRTARVLSIAQSIAKSDATVLIEGESGTGKEVLARFIHQQSGRADRPFVAVNCAAVPATLLETELFGHEKGAFTGAIQSKKGKFELAEGGTILLDEIGEMEPVLQAKLLRVLQEREIDRVGGTSPRPVDVRVVCTTNANLPKLVSQGKFREDLFYRLNVIPLTLPPLRERKGDVRLLAQHFVDAAAKKHGRPQLTLASETADLLEKYEWRGNVRELANTIERAVLLCDGPVVGPASLFIVENRQVESAADAKDEDGVRLSTGTSLRDMERRLIELTLRDVGQNRTKAAKLLGISIRTLRNKLHEYGAADAGDAPGGDESDDTEDETA